MTAYTAVRRLFEKAFAECGLDEVTAAHAIRILRSLVRGFVINEMSGSAAASADFDESFDFAMDVFIGGLPELMKPHCAKQQLNRHRPLFALEASAGALSANLQ